MLQIAIIAGVGLIIFNYFIRQRKSRQEERREELRELRQKELDRILGKEERENL